MLRVEVIGIVNATGSMCSTKVISNKVELLSADNVVIDGPSKRCVVDKQFFMRLPAKHELVFKVVIDGKHEGCGTLSKEYVSSVALAVSLKRTLALKPLSCGVQIKMDFVVLDAQSSTSSSSSAVLFSSKEETELSRRYQRLFDELNAHRQVRSLTATPSSSLQSPPSPTTQQQQPQPHASLVSQFNLQDLNSFSSSSVSSSGRQSLRMASTTSRQPTHRRILSMGRNRKSACIDVAFAVPENNNNNNNNNVKKGVFSVLNTFVSAGSPVVHGTSLVLVTETCSNETSPTMSSSSPSSSSSPLSYRSAGGGSMYASYAENTSVHDADMGSPKTGYSVTRSPTTPSRPLAKSFKSVGNDIEIQWTKNVAGIVTEVVVTDDRILSPGDVLIRVDISDKAQQMAHLMLADQAASRRAASSSVDEVTINSRYQALAEAFSDAVRLGTYDDISSIMSCCLDLERVARDFYGTARTYAEVIISEMHLPVEAKTVRPLKMGGVLGGHKYAIRGILFKLGDGEMFQKYPDPLHIANKIQGHELKGLRAYFGWFFNRGLLNKVSFPLAAVIDYKGHRVTAMTQLPIKGHDTLIYGSDDAGGNCTVSDDVPEFSALIREASMGLGLLPHFVVNGRAEGGEIELASCVDLEGHRGMDGRNYLLDFSRTFPPAFKEHEKCDEWDQFWPFYHMMRPEYLASGQRKLSADAFSNFQSTINATRKAEAVKNNDDLRATTTLLQTEGVIRVCRAFLSAKSDNLASMAQIFHQHGLNMRYLGLVYLQLVSPSMFSGARHNLYTLIQCESLVRVFKNYIRMNLRKAHAGGANSESRVLAETASLMNRLFGNFPSVTAFMEKNDFCQKSLIADFHFDERSSRSCIEVMFHKRTVSDGERTLSAKAVVLHRLNEALGLGLSVSRLAEGGESIFDEFDFSFVARVKNLDIVERACAMRFFLRAYQDDFLTSASREYLTRGFEAVERALKDNPNDPFLCGLAGDLCWRLHKSNELFSGRAEMYFKQAALADTSSFLAQMKYGLFLSELGGTYLAEAELRMLTAFELASQRADVVAEEHVIAMISVLEQRGKPDMARQFREIFSSRGLLVGSEPLDSSMGGGGSVISIPVPSSGGSSATSPTMDHSTSRPSLKEKFGKFLNRKHSDADNMLSPISLPNVAADVLLEGWLGKAKLDRNSSSSASKVRYIQLDRSGNMHYWDSPGGRHMGSMALSSSHTPSLSEDGASLSVQLSGGLYTLSRCPESTLPMSKWLDAINEVISLNSARRKPPMVSPKSTELSAPKSSQHHRSMSPTRK